MKQLFLIGVPLVLLAAAAPSPVPAFAGSKGFEKALDQAGRALEAGGTESAEAAVLRALERDAKSIRAWELRGRIAQEAGDRDLHVYCLHQEYRLAVAQGRPSEERDAARARLLEADPQAGVLLELQASFVERLLPLAVVYEEEGRLHSAVRVHKEILALDPERAESLEAIDRITQAPDPSLAEDAKPRDLLEGVSAEWIAEHDEEHATWKDRARLKSEHYVVQTNAGYETLVTMSEAMEQMNAFYRVFFRHDTAVPRIELNIFKTRDEYLKLAQGPPVEWSGGHYTGSAVETYADQSLTGTLFHEAAHQFVDLATNASGWLNEGIASFFEGCQLLPNGTVLMNLPANHRLFALAGRMDEGWMADADDGFDPSDKQAPVRKAPSFRIVLENEYEWGPPWYAPTWGVVYFLYNYQDPADGRFVYRGAFQDFIDRSGGRVGKGAIKNFEEIVLQNPAPPTKGADVPRGSVALPETVDELNEVWKDYILHLRDEQSGRVEIEYPYHEWALHAVKRGDGADAAEFFEKGLRESPFDPDLLVDFGELLIEEENEDRAAKLFHRALKTLETADEVDEKRVAELDRRLRRIDPQHETLESIRSELVSAETRIVQGYLAEGLDRMAMDLAWRTGNDFHVPAMFEYFEEALRRSGRSLALWQLAYNEEDLSGWSASGEGIFAPRGENLVSTFGQYAPEDYEFRFLTLNKVTSGDFSLEAEVQAELGKVNFGGIVFGQKTGTDFQSVLFLPPGRKSGGIEQGGYVDLAAFFGNDDFTTLAHVAAPRAEGQAQTRSVTWTKLRVDVTGRNVDVWCDDQFVTTREYPNLSVLRGRFGLLVGKGSMRFRNVRYLARETGDPGAQIERAVRMEAFAAAGGSKGGSWIGMEPPFPRVSRWVKNDRTGWDDVDLAPQLLVLFSIAQNKLIPLHGWLRNLDETYGEYGLEFVCIAEGWDGDTIESYLPQHPFPGAVGIDEVIADNTGYTHDQYATKKFNLPRVILIDVDGTVAWEGDPGFRVGDVWEPGKEDYLKAPLEELLERRDLKRLVAWRNAWSGTARPAILAGAVAEAADCLIEASGYDWKIHDDILSAQRCLQAVEGAAAAIEATADAFARGGFEPATDVLLEWVDELDLPIDSKAARAVSRGLKGGNSSEWKKALKILRPLPKDVEKGDFEDVAEAIGELRELGGAFPAMLAEGLEAAGEDADALLRVIEEAEGLPARWLANEHFRWGGDEGAGKEN